MTITNAEDIVKKGFNGFIYKKTKYIIDMMINGVIICHNQYNEKYIFLSKDIKEENLTLIY